MIKKTIILCSVLAMSIGASERITLSTLIEREALSRIDQNNPEWRHDMLYALVATADEMVAACDLDESRSERIDMATAAVVTELMLSGYPSNDDDDLVNNPDINAILPTTAYALGAGSILQEISHMSFDELNDEIPGYREFRAETLEGLAEIRRTNRKMEELDEEIFRFVERIDDSGSNTSN